MINNGGVAEVYQVQYTCCLGWEYIEILIAVFFSPSGMQTYSSGIRFSHCSH